jgi:nitrite reductase/ring-hydroxylating ferredoxin subunit
MTWQLVTKRENVSSGAPFAFSHADKNIAIFRIDDDYYATDNVCPHAYALLTEGFVEGDQVECALHGAIFHIPTGRCVAPPADCDLQTYPVKIENDQIYVDV